MLNDIFRTTADLVLIATAPISLFGGVTWTSLPLALQVGFVPVFLLTAGAFVGSVAHATSKRHRPYMEGP